MTFCFSRVKSNGSRTLYRIRAHESIRINIPHGVSETIANLQVRHRVDNEHLTVPGRPRFVLLLRRNDAHLYSRVNHPIKDVAATIGSGFAIAVAARHFRDGILEMTLVTEGRFIYKQNLAEDLEMVEDNQGRSEACIVCLLSERGMQRLVSMTPCVKDETYEMHAENRSSLGLDRLVENMVCKVCHAV